VKDEGEERCDFVIAISAAKKQSQLGNGAQKRTAHPTNSTQQNTSAKQRCFESPWKMLMKDQGQEDKIGVIQCNINIRC
jgi:hypothetical protein